VREGGPFCGLPKDKLCLNASGQSFRRHVTVARHSRRSVFDRVGEVKPRVPTKECNLYQRMGFLFARERGILSQTSWIQGHHAASRKPNGIKD
jgi:hypothetical protein